MRTLVVVLVLVGIAAAAGGSFVVRAQDGGAAAATLEHTCAPDNIVNNAATPIRCSFTAHNSGGAVLHNLQLTFTPGGGAIPDAYYFVSASRDGVPIGDVLPGTLTYGYGDLAPGVSSTIQIVVIVRSSHPYEARVLLSNDNGATSLASATLGNAVDAISSGVFAELTPPSDEEATGTKAGWTLTVKNGSDNELHDVQAELTFDGDVRILAPGASGGADSSTSAVLEIGDLSPMTSRELEFQLVNSGCAYVQGAAIVSGESTGARFETGAIAAPTAFGNCTSGRGQGGGGAQMASDGSLLALPSTGSGRSHSSRVGDGVLVLAIGLLLLAAGVSVRRAHRR